MIVERIAERNMSGGRGCWMHATLKDLALINRGWEMRSFQKVGRQQYQK